MTTYTVQGADGKTYTLDGPAGATAEQLSAALQQHSAPPDNRPATLKEWVAKHPQTAQTLHDIGSRMESFAGGVNDLTFGIPNLLVNTVGGPSLAKINTAQEQAKAQYPAEKWAGRAVGLAASIPAAVATGPAAETSLGARLATYAGQGAAGGGLSGYSKRGSGTDAAVGAALGAPLGAAGGALVEGIAAIPGAANATYQSGSLRAAYDKLVNSQAVKMLAKTVAAKSGMTPEQAADHIATQMAVRKEVTGVAPSIQEVLPNPAARAVGKYAGRTEEAAATGRQAESAANAQRVNTMQNAVAEGGPIPAAADLRAEANTTLTDAMTKIGVTQVPIAANEADALLGDTSLFRQLPAALRKRVSTNWADSGKKSLPLSDIEDIRYEARLRGKGETHGENIQQWRDYRNLARGIGETNVPEYGSVMNSYAATMRRADTAEKIGVPSPSVNNPIQFAGKVREAGRVAQTPEVQQGVKLGAAEGARSQLHGNAGSESGALDLAYALAKDKNTSDALLQVLPPGELARLKAVGGSEWQAAQNLGYAAPASAADQTIHEQIVHGAAAAIYRDPMLKAWAIARLLSGKAALPGTAKRIIELATSPKKADQQLVINALMHKGVRPSVSRRILSDLAAAQLGSAGGQ